MCPRTPLFRVEKGSVFVAFCRKESIFVDIIIIEKNLVGVTAKISIYLLSSKKIELVLQFFGIKTLK